GAICTLRPLRRLKATNGGDDARPSDPDDRAWGLRPTHHDRHAPPDPAPRKAHAALAVRGAESTGYPAPGLQRPQRGAETEVRGRKRARPIVRYPGARALPLQ